MENKKKFIVVEGPIGVGKTTLATKLAHTLNSKLLLENFSNNPFLKFFYKDIKRYALPTQLFFLLQRSNEFTDKKYNEIFDNSLVSDYFLDKDKLFAEITLTNDELILYKRIISIN
jgi:deoxyadenosine/deoxycytidine kinase